MILTCNSYDRGACLMVSFYFHDSFYTYCNSSVPSPAFIYYLVICFYPYGHMDICFSLWVVSHYYHGLFSCSDCPRLGRWKLLHLHPHQSCFCSSPILHPGRNPDVLFGWCLLALLLSPIASQSVTKSCWFYLHLLPSLRLASAPSLVLVLKVRTSSTLVRISAIDSYFLLSSLSQQIFSPSCSQSELSKRQV